MMNNTGWYLRFALLALLGFSATSPAHNRVVVISMGGNEPAKDKVIFLTKDRYIGAFGSLYYADTICQADADEQDSKVKGKNFKAWLGPTSDPMAGERDFTVYELPYVTPNGEVYVQSYSTLLTMLPWPFISVAADGSEVSDVFALDAVWTGRRFDGGAILNQHCDSWNHPSFQGAQFVEQFPHQSKYSSTLRVVDCYDPDGENLARLICMEQ